MIVKTVLISSKISLDNYTLLHVRFFYHKISTFSFSTAPPRTDRIKSILIVVSWFLKGYHFLNKFRGNYQFSFSFDCESSPSDRQLNQQHLIQDYLQIRASYSNPYGLRLMYPFACCMQLNEKELGG